MRAAAKTGLAGWRSLVTLNKFLSRGSAPRGARAKLIRDPTANSAVPETSKALPDGAAIYVNTR